MSKTFELFESIQNNLKEPEDLDSYWQKNYQKIIDFVDETGPEYIADLIYDGDINMFNQNTGKQVALDLLHQLGIKELENELKMLNESEESTLLKSYQETDYGYHNNATMIYGELNDGNWYVYIPDNDAFDIYNEPITNKFIDCSYNYQTDDDRADDTWYDNFVKEHEITKNYDNDIINKIISELDHKYFGDDFYRLKEDFIMSNTKQLFESIQSHLNEAVFEIDYAGEGDLSTEEAIINNVKEWLGDLSDKVKVEVKEVKGPGAGWPEVRLIGDKELIGTFLNKEYNSGADSLEDTYDLYLLKESDEVPYCDDVNCEPVKEAEEEEVQTEEQPQEEVQTEEPVNEFEQLSPEVQTILNDMSNDNAMYKWVIDDVMDSVIDYEGDSMDEKLKSRLTEIMDRGCQSGTVGSLIYYTDTVKFFDNFNDEIYDIIDYDGAQSVLKMLQQKCDLADIIMGADIVKNYLTWMAYETVCSDILDVIESM